VHRPPGGTKLFRFGDSANSGPDLLFLSVMPDALTYAEALFPGRTAADWDWPRFSPEESKFLAWFALRYESVFARPVTCA
jgi:hypothetical protein